MKNPLHRKKLAMLVQRFASPSNATPLSERNMDSHSITSECRLVVHILTIKSQPGSAQISNIKKSDLFNSTKIC